MVEYGLMLALIAIVAMAGAAAIGTKRQDAVQHDGGDPVIQSLPPGVGSHSIDHGLSTVAGLASVDDQATMPENRGLGSLTRKVTKR